MKVKTGIKAGGMNLNHNEAQGGLKVQTGLKAGGLSLNHNCQSCRADRGSGGAIRPITHRDREPARVELGDVVPPSRGRLGTGGLQGGWRSAMKAKTGIKAGMPNLQHNEAQGGLKVQTGIKAGMPNLQHNEAQGGLKVRTGVRAGGIHLNHNEAPGGLKVQTGVKAGGVNLNHNEALARSA